MDNTAFMSKAIRYQKTAADQVFELMSLYQSSSEELLKKTLEQFTWLPGISKESYLSWNSSYQESTNRLKDMVDTGFEQVEQVFASPILKDNTEKKSQSSQKAAAPSQKTVSRKKTKPQPKTSVAKATPSKAKSSVQKPQASKSVGGAKAASASVSAALVSPKAIPSKVNSVQKSQPSTSAGAAKSTSTSAPNVKVSSKAAPSVTKTSEQKSDVATPLSDTKPTSTPTS
ncbi:MAG: hypothetical protein GY799_22580 [Desulfobulbaceae bacterium]|nr:hypothetical protein [Desulfobulbaceae bacterium]